MQYLTLKKTIKGRLARFSASTSLDQWIDLELNNAIEELEEEGFLPWFLRKSATLATVADQLEVTLPTDYLSPRISDADEPEVSFLRRLGADNYWAPMVALERGPLQAGLITATATDQQMPTTYYVDGVAETISMGSWPDDAYTLEFDYIAKGDRYTSDPADTEEPSWAKYAPGYLIALCGLRISQLYIKNKAAAQMFLADVQRERTKLIHKHTLVLESQVAANSEN